MKSIVMIGFYFISDNHHKFVELSSHAYTKIGMKVMVNHMRMMRYSKIILFIFIFILSFFIYEEPKKAINIADDEVVTTYLASSIPINTLSVEKMFDYDYENLSLDNLLKLFMSEYSLDENSISISYYNFDTKEQYSLNQDIQRFGASTYKLPLNMFFSELIYENIYDEYSTLNYCEQCSEDRDGYIYNNYMIGDEIDLTTLQYQSIINSDNTASWILFNELGGWDVMMDVISKYSSDPTITMSSENYFTSAYMLEALIYLYENVYKFEELLNNLLNASPSTYLQKYMEVPVAHKYGQYGTALNDVGIVYGESPYAISIYTDNIIDGEDIIGLINRLIYEYTVFSDIL